MNGGDDKKHDDQKAKTSLKAGSASEITLATAGFTAAPGIEYTRDTTPAAAGGTLAELEQAIGIAAYDVRDRGRRIVALIQRLDPMDSARRFVKALKGTMYGRTAESAALRCKTVAEFREAAAKALEAQPPGVQGEWVFVEETSPRDDGTGLSSVLTANPPPDAVELTDWLTKNNAFLVIMIAVEPHDKISKIVESYPGAYRLPWVEPWLLRIGKRLDYTYDEVRDFRLQIATIANNDTPDGSTREKNLFSELQKLESPTPGGERDISDFAGLQSAIDKAIEQSVSQEKLEEAGRKRLDAIFGIPRGDDDKQLPYWEDPIARVVLALAVFLNTPAEHIVVDLARALLPDGEASTRFYSERMKERREEQERREKWQSTAKHKDARVPPPHWRDVFDEEPEKFIANAELVLSEARTLVPGSDLAPLRLRDILVSKPQFVRSLAERIVRRHLFFMLPDGLLPALLDFVAEVQALPGNLLTTGDLVTIMTGLADGRASFAVTADIAIHAANTRVLDLVQNEDRAEAPAIRDFFSLIARDVRYPGDFEHLGMSRAAVRAPSRVQVTAQTGDGEMTGEINHPEEEQAERERLGRLRHYARILDEEIRFPAVARVHRFLAWIEAHPKWGTGSYEAFLEEVAARASFRDLWLLFASLLVHEPKPSQKVLGEWTLRAFDRTALGDPGFSNLVEIFKLTVGAAAAQAPGRIVAFDLWADAIHTAAHAAKTHEAATPLSVFTDDFLTNFEIPWTRRGLDRDKTEPPVLASRFLAQEQPGEGLAIMNRLFARSAETHLQALMAFERLISDDPSVSAQRQVFERMGDVFYAVTDEVDPGEERARGLDYERIENLVWAAITASLGIPICHTSYQCATLVIERAGYLPGNPLHRPVVLLDLYAPAVLLTWRFRALPSAPMAIGAPEAMRFKAALEGFKRAGHKRMSNLYQAFQALEQAETVFIDHLKFKRCDKTVARHEERLRAIRGIAKVFAPTAVQTV